MSTRLSGATGRQARSFRATIQTARERSGNEGDREDRDHALRPGGLPRGRQERLRGRQADDRPGRPRARGGLRRRLPDGRRRHLGRVHAARVPHEQVRRPRPRGLPDPRRRVERHGPQAHDRQVRRADRLRVRHHPRGARGRRQDEGDGRARLRHDQPRGQDRAGRGRRELRHDGLRPRRRRLREGLLPRRLLRPAPAQPPRLLPQVRPVHRADEVRLEGHARHPQALRAARPSR